MKKYSILINTCDKFDDCWSPFFKLFSIYWSDCTAQLYLNTEYKQYNYEGLKISSIQGCMTHNIPKNERATWSECLLWALESIDSDIILYMQEDYFLTDNVKNEIVENYVSLMNDNPDIHCIQLTHPSVKPLNRSKYTNLYTVDKQHWSVVSCQASLWRKDILKQYIRTYESAWNFEWWGSKRAAILDHNFYIVDNKWVVNGQFAIIPYIFTGIIGGKWFKPVVELFNNHDIVVDYDKRGFYEDKKSTYFDKQRYRLKGLPVEIRNYWDMLKLKYQKH